MSRFDNMLEVTYGGIPLDVLSLSDNEGRDIARFAYPHRKGIAAKDMGGQGRTTSATILFFEKSPGDDWWDRFTAMVTLKDEGDPQPFVHPLTGSYDALIADFTWQVEPSTWNAVSVSCTFVEASPEPAVFDAGPGSPLLAAVQAVNAASKAARDAMAAAWLAGDLPSEPYDTANVEAAIADWPNSTIRDINHELVKYANEINDATNDLQLASDIDRYPSLVAMNQLRYQLQRAADTITQVAPRLLEKTIEVTVPLLVFAADFYGAEQSVSRAEEIQQLNVIRNPARVEAGTTLRLTAPVPSEAR